MTTIPVLVSSDAGDAPNRAGGAIWGVLVHTGSEGPYKVGGVREVDNLLHLPGAAAPASRPGGMPGAAGSARVAVA